MTRNSALGTPKYNNKPHNTHADIISRVKTPHMHVPQRTAPSPCHNFNTKDTKPMQVASISLMYHEKMLLCHATVLQTAAHVNGRTRTDLTKSF